MNCNAVWYLQSGACLPLWANIIFFVVAFFVGALWAELLTFRAKHIVMFMFVVLALLLAFAVYTNNKKLIGAIKYILKRK